jgi:hypothetical protein
VSGKKKRGMTCQPNKIMSYFEIEVCQVAVWEFFFQISNLVFLRSPQPKKKELLALFFKT